MAASVKLTGYQTFMAVVSAVSAIALAAIFTQMLWQATTLGEHSVKLDDVPAKIAAAEGGVLDRIDRLEKALTKQNDEIKIQVGAIEASIRATSLNLPEIIAKLGVVKQQDVMHAVIFENVLYAIPANADAAARFTAAGMQRQMLGDAVSAFRIVPVSAIAGQPLAGSAQPAVMPVE